MNDNRIKSINGLRSKSSLLEILKSLKEADVISYCSADYRCGYPGAYVDQFYAPFFLQFPNGNAWVVFSTNSIRSDRISIQQWNAENIKKIKKNITRAVVVVPDEVLENEKERREVEKYNEKITSGNYYSALDYIYYQSQFERTIRESKQ